MVLYKELKYGAIPDDTGKAKRLSLNEAKGWKLQQHCRGVLSGQSKDEAVRSWQLLSAVE